MGRQEHRVLGAMAVRKLLCGQTLGWSRETEGQAPLAAGVERCRGARGARQWGPAAGQGGHDAKTRVRYMPRVPITRCLGGHTLLITADPGRNGLCPQVFWGTRKWSVLASGRERRQESGRGCRGGPRRWETKSEGCREMLGWWEPPTFPAPTTFPRPTDRHTASKSETSPSTSQRESRCPQGWESSGCAEGGAEESHRRAVKARNQEGRRVGARRGQLGREDGRCCSGAVGLLTQPREPQPPDRLDREAPIPGTHPSLPDSAHRCGNRQTGGQTEGQGGSRPRQRARPALRCLSPMEGWPVRLTWCTSPDLPGGPQVSCVHKDSEVASGLKRRQRRLAVSGQGLGRRWAGHGRLPSLHSQGPRAERQLSAE